MFPRSVSGILTIGESANLPVVEVVKRLQERLSKLHPTKLTVAADSVSFEAGMLRAVWNYNLLVPFGHGLIHVREEAGMTIVAYKLSIAQLTATGTVMSLMFANLSWRQGWDRALIVLAGGWLLFVGGNCALGVRRFRSFLRDLAHDPPRMRPMDL